MKSSLCLALNRHKQRGQAGRQHGWFSLKFCQIASLSRLYDHNYKMWFQHKNVSKPKIYFAIIVIELNGERPIFLNIILYLRMYVPFISHAHAFSLPFPLTKQTNKRPTIEKKKQKQKENMNFVSSSFSSHVEQIVFTNRYEINSPTKRQEFSWFMQSNSEADLYLYCHSFFHCIHSLRWKMICFVLFCFFSSSQDWAVYCTHAVQK